MLSIWVAVTLSVLVLLATIGVVTMRTLDAVARTRVMLVETRDDVRRRAAGARTDADQLGAATSAYLPRRRDEERPR